MNTLIKSKSAYIFAMFFILLSSQASAGLSCKSVLKKALKIQSSKTTTKKDSQNHDLYEKAVWVYEAVFKPFFVGGVRKSIDSIKDLDPKNILEVGVGTGYSLKYYPKGVPITGVDISDGMVKKSQERAKEISETEINIYNISNLSEKELKNSADVVSSFSVITVVPEPQKFLDELTSYTKPGGHIVLIMHMRGKGAAGFIDRTVDVVTQKLFGFTLLRRITDYDLSAFESVEIKPVSRFLRYPYNHMIILKKKDL